MTIANFLKASVARWLSSEKRLKFARFRTELVRKVRRADHIIYYFHRADDPYCQLMVQVLPDIASRFNVVIKPLVVEKLPANMYPDPQRYEAYTILDASRLARLYGLGFSLSATVPDRLAVGMANRFLASRQSDPAFFTLAEEIGAALWRQDLATVRNMCSIADVSEDTLTENEKKLHELGHYASACLSYGGEFYVGVDRLDHLERRLNALGLGDDETGYEIHRLWRYDLEELERSVSAKTVEVFFSVRSPFSYVGLELISELAEKTGVRLLLKPVLPMMMRGMKVPPAKRGYIFQDTAREARLEGVAFGKVVDPLGEATWRAMQIGYALQDLEKDGQYESGKALTFFRTCMRAVWSEGVDASTDKGMAQILVKSGLATDFEKQALSREETKRRAELNKNEMFRYGSWGVPTFRVEGETVWGQDRMWAIVDALKQ
ncbi:DsbA family protein [Kordiimonas aquimaris]|uniref:DsbA family protein n=1 Tax=Kordiimonas aquimaris TaxID=707591 RepID=UPI0021D317CF|nr:DsbA family protein [Kordiimonas aquimaris]